MKYRYLEHTADLYVEVYGKNLREIFENAAIAFYDSICYIEKVDKKIKREINVDGEDIQELLINFLNELLYIFEVDGFIASEINVDVGKKINAILVGEKYQIEKHGAKYNIKAATYHGLEINEKEGYARILFDI